MKKIQLKRLFVFLMAFILFSSTTSAIMAEEVETTPVPTTTSTDENTEEKTDTTDTSTSEDTKTEDTTDTSEKTEDTGNTVEESTEEITEESTDAEIDAEADKAVDEIISEVETMAPEKQGAQLKAIENRIRNQLAKLKKQLKENPDQSKRIQKQIKVLNKMMIRLKAKKVGKKIGVMKKMEKRDQLMELYEIRWGNLSANREACKEVSSTDLAESIDNDIIPEECLKNTEAIDYSGVITVNHGMLKFKKGILLEKNEDASNDGDQLIGVNSKVFNHWDGILVSYTPDENAETEPELTINLGNYNKTFPKGDIIGRKDMGNNHQIEIKPLIRALKSLDKNAQIKLLNSKLRIKEKVDGAREKVSRLRLLGKEKANFDELEDTLEEVDEYNFDDETQTEVEAEIEALTAALNDEISEEGARAKITELKAKIKALKKLARERKWKKKLIPFKDTDDNAWYTPFVVGAKDRGIFSGYKDRDGNELGEFRPGNDITVAEILKVALETAQKGKSENNQAPKVLKAANHWSRQYVKRAEELGVDLVNDVNIDLNRPATRAEVIRLVLEALDVSVPEITSSNFSDVAINHKAAKFIEYARVLGIISGDAGKTTFRPDEPINRAEASKIVNQIVETLLEG